MTTAAAEDLFAVDEEAAAPEAQDGVIRYLAHQVQAYSRTRAELINLLSGKIIEFTDLQPNLDIAQADTATLAGLVRDIEETTRGVIGEIDTVTTPELIRCEFGLKFNSVNPKVEDGAVGDTVEFTLKLSDSFKHCDDNSSVATACKFNLNGTTVLALSITLHRPEVRAAQSS